MVWFCAYHAHFTIDSLCLVVKLAYELFVVRFVFYALEKCDKKGNKSQEMWIEAGAPMFKVTIFISYFLIGLKVYYFIWLHIYLGTKISTLYNLIKSFFK